MWAAVLRLQNMATPHVPPTTANRGSGARVRQVLRWAGTAVLIGNALFWSLTEGAFAATALDGPDEPVSNAAVLWWLLWTALGIAAAVALVWRRRYAFVICLVTAGAAIVFPISFFAPWWALVWVLITDRWRNIVIAAAAATVAITATLWRDHARGPDAMLTFADDVTGQDAVMDPAGYVAIGLLALVLAAAIGLVRRYQATARAARQAEAASTRTAQVLRTELSRQEERDLIAREMHDTVAHHLSLVSLHASALEVTATDPATDVPQAARSMRDSAQRALQEMRTLIAGLREPAEGGGAELTGTTPSLDDLPTLVDEARRAGADIAPTIFIAEAHSAPPALTRTVYRVVQESLTNTVKHAPGAPVLLDVRAAPDRGVQITVTNSMVPTPVMLSAGGTEGPDGPDGPGGADGATAQGSGQRGMAERVGALGGTFRAGPDGDAYVVQAELPWHPASQG